MPVTGHSPTFRRTTTRCAAVLTAAALTVGLQTGPAAADPASDTGRDTNAWAGASCPVTADGPLTGTAADLHATWLRRVTDSAGIDLDAWTPRAGVAANTTNLERSYDRYLAFQLDHRELQWAGMGGLSGADFGGGLLDMDVMATVYRINGVQPLAQQIVAGVRDAAGQEAVNQLPSGLRALANAPELTPDDLDYVIGEILVMQKAIFCDLMPMHQAYVDGGLPALQEMADAGVFPSTVMDAWRDIASGDPERIAAGNATLLRREQLTVIGDRWDAVRNYRDGLGEAMTYASTMVGSPSVGGVEPMRSWRPIKFTQQLPGGTEALVTVPLPAWDWSQFDERWEYITDQLLPGYTAQVTNDWEGLTTQLTTPMVWQMQTHRPLANLGVIAQDAADTFTVEIR
ncbi:hypothetical protein [Corynebacterium terpenotabidum]|uniref:Secreted protein n=1 Tax=Corynebacterium terpenotabidum Y-11 TaxID=1200352 RepID=S4XCV2_9CORY|nr:hypothetical protein [Corynebacterium terpenotabidum]AGP30416.1 hypothetical protein A606_03835 [Corynebacterium terpenotabidum Y-11]